MNKITIVSERPRVEEYSNLRKSIGWKVVDDNILEKGIENSIYCVCVRNGEDLIGFGRIVGDGATVFYVQDIMVKPLYQKQKIGTLIMENIVDYIKANVDERVIVALIAKCELNGFYKKFNFKCNEEDLFFRYQNK